MVDLKSSSLRKLLPVHPFIHLSILKKILLEQIYKRVAAKTKRWMSMTYDHVMYNLKEMSTVDDALEILGDAIAEDIEAEIFSITQGAKNN